MEEKRIKLSDILEEHNKSNKIEENMDIKEETEVKEETEETKETEEAQEKEEIIFNKEIINNENPDKLELDCINVHKSDSIIQTENPDKINNMDEKEKNYKEKKTEETDNAKNDINDSKDIKDKKVKGRKTKIANKVVNRILIILVIISIIIIAGILLINKYKDKLDESPLKFINDIANEETKDNNTPEEVVNEYFTTLLDADYQKLYEMISDASKNSYTFEEFEKRLKNIYTGIEATDFKVSITKTRVTDEYTSVTFNQSMNTITGEISFDNVVRCVKDDNNTWKMSWNDSIIFPDLGKYDKIYVTTTKAKRGTISDRNGAILAASSKSATIGIEPGKLPEDKVTSLNTIAQLLGTTSEDINNKLSASWVKNDSFVPIKTLYTVDTDENYENVKAQLKSISGVIIRENESRSYPQGETISHLIGYIQTVSENELEKLDETYNLSSKIGKTGLENVYESRLHGVDGCKITLYDDRGSQKRVIGEKLAADGENITTTIDITLQTKIYNELKSDNTASVVINPKTGEVLALVSTPSYDNNDFITGLSTDKWNILSNDTNKPLFTRFSASYCPGSSFKPLTAAIGITTKTLDPNENFGNSGTSWQKDNSWGTYKVTTLHTYGNDVTLRNALIYSDNIYFAKAGLKVGAGVLAEGLEKAGFKENIDFPMSMVASTYSTTDSISSEIQLADTGYGQGQLLVNPLHMAAVYSAFVNDGNIIKPILELSETGASYWKEGAFTKEAADIVKEALIDVVNNPNGTAYKVKNSTTILAGKTGTAELKASQSTSGGMELGWFNVFTTDKDDANSLLMVTMIEDVNGRGGSGYVVGKTKTILDQVYK